MSVLSRFRLAALLGFVTMFTGCDSASVIRYADNPKLSSEVEKPILRQKIRQAVVDLFGPAPNAMLVPAATHLRDGGIFLADTFADNFEGERKATGDPLTNGQPIAGGYALYRKHCLHCHGLSGDGNGPTGPFLFPRPRDFRNGMFKFTSTPYGEKPTRDDLYKTVKNGLHGTSMPSFDALMTESEIQQVLDYTIYLSIRGETELKLIQQAKEVIANLEEGKDVDPNAKPGDALAVDGEPANILEIAQKVDRSWASAVPRLPSVARAPVTPASINHGREIFLKNCTTCHGKFGDVTNSEKYIDRAIFDAVVFRQQQLHHAVFARFQILKANGTRQSEAGHSHGAEHGAHPPAEPAAAPAQIANFLATTPLAVDYLFDPQAWTDHPNAPFPSSADQKELQAFRKNLVDAPEGMAKELVKKFPMLADASFQEYFKKNLDLWKNSRDEIWFQPLLPANLRKGVYKGGRRPLDIYLRLSNGITATTMPAHVPTPLKPEEVWDAVNFVLALPDNPGLLGDPSQEPPPTLPAPGTTSPSSPTSTPTPNAKPPAPLGE